MGRQTFEMHDYQQALVRLCPNQIAESNRQREKEVERLFDITVYTVCWNEELMLPHFLRHYSQLARRIVIYDNFSTDRSVAIASSFPDVEVRQFDTGGQFSELDLTNIRNTCWKSDESDYVIVCDVDEFLYSENLGTFLSSHPEYDAFRPVGFNMVSARFPSDYSIPLTSQVKRGAYAPLFSKLVLFKPSRISAMNFGPGSHLANPSGHAELKVYDALHGDRDLRLLHYKFLGLDYVGRRHSSIGDRLGSEFEKHGFGFHYKFDASSNVRKYLELKMLSYNCVERRKHPLFDLTRFLLAAKGVLSKAVRDAVSSSAR